jgi:hypothetical protein
MIIKAKLLPLAFALGLAALAASCTTAKKPFPIKLSANPSALVAEEIALKQAATLRGTAAALREFAAPDAVLFVPRPVAAPAYLKDNAVSLSLNRSVHNIIMSCDGKTGVTTGAWSDAGGAQGYFTTVWQRYERADGSGKWLWALTHNDMLKTARNTPDFLATKTASCKGSAPATVSAPDVGVQMKQGIARDQSLSWTWQYRPDQSRTLRVSIWDGEKMVPALNDAVAPAPEAVK